MSTLALDAVAAGDGVDISRIAGMLAHELRNPLASAATNLAVATDLCDASDPRVPFLRRAEQEMDRIRVLLRSCLDLACAGRIETRRASVREVLEAAIQPSSNDRDVSIELSVDAALEAQVDPVLIARAIENLVENAVRAVDASGSCIRLTARVTDGALWIGIEDDGPGIPAELEARVFEPFVTGSRGSGLGLAFVRRVAEAHGGRAFAGRSELGGARFEIELPIGG